MGGRKERKETKPAEKDNTNRGGRVFQGEDRKRTHVENCEENKGDQKIKRGKTQHPELRTVGTGRP